MSPSWLNQRVAVEAAASQEGAGAVQTPKALLGGMVTSLSGMVADVRSNAALVAQAGQQLVNEHQALSDRTELQATNLAQKAHKVGFFHNLAVAVTILSATMGALFGGAKDEWREGVPARLAIDGQDQPGEERFAIVATALKRLPFGLKPFGAPREGLKLLDVDAPPRRLMKALPMVLSGKAEPALEGLGYRRRDPRLISLAGGAPFVLDGEVYEGGDLTIGLGPSLRFLVG